MAKKIITPTGSNIQSLKLHNRSLELENAILSKKISLTEKRLDNSFSDLAAGLTGASGFGGPMSNLTSFNPTLQNNQYAPITLMWTALMYAYKTHGLIQTAIDQPVLDALRGGLEFTSDGQVDSDDIARLEEYLEENAILERIGDAFIWTRLFGGGALIINSEVDGVDQGEVLGDEIMEGPIEFYDACRWELTCDRRIPKSGKYGYYGKTLDQSRVLTICGKRAPWLIRAQLSDWGMSEYERMVEDFNLFLRTRNVIYELLEEAKVDVYALKNFTSALVSSTGTQITQKRVQAMNSIKSYNNALIMDKDDEYMQKQVSFGGLSEIMKMNQMGIASALRMPMSKLFGIPSTGYSSGEDDIENYNGMVMSEVREPMRKVIRKVLNVIVRHLFHDDLKIDFEFKPLRILSSLDEEAQKTSKANRYNALYDRMLMSSKEMGEALQKENLVPIQLAAEKGLLDEHPEAAAGQAGPQGEEGEPIEDAASKRQEAKKGKIPVAEKEKSEESEKLPSKGAKPVKLPTSESGSGKGVEKPKPPEKPKKPKLA